MPRRQNVSLPKKIEPSSAVRIADLKRVVARVDDSMFDDLMETTFHLRTTVQDVILKGLTEWLTTNKPAVNALLAQKARLAAKAAR